MKVEMDEYDGCFRISFTAETVEDAAKLSRMAVNRTTELRSCSADAYKDGTFYGHIIIGKRRDSTSTIKRSYKK